MKNNGSEDARKDISRRMIGNNYGIGNMKMLGKKHNEETKIKISEKKKGKKLSDKHREKISVSLIGNRRSANRRKKEATDAD